MEIRATMDLAAIWAATRPRYEELRGRVALVTGSGRGIGTGIALRLAREGMKVVITSNIAADVERTSAALAALGAEVLPVVADMARGAEVRRLVRETVEGLGGLDLLVNNAAIVKLQSIFTVDEQLLDDELAVNVRAPYLGAQLAAEIMRERGGGGIVSISSVGGARAHWQGLPYDVTKGAIDAMTRTMALDLAGYGIRVNAIAPGAIDTGHPYLTQPGVRAALTERIPMLRMGTPGDIGALVAFLASEDASYITGQVLYVDGGITAQLSPKNSPI